jgi:hypothetical protein
LIFQQPQNPDTIGKQVLFWNGELTNQEGKMFGDQSYTYEGAWMRNNISQIKDLWNNPYQVWLMVRPLVATLRKRLTEERRHEIINSIPGIWCPRQQKIFEEGEWW